MNIKVKILSLMLLSLIFVMGCRTPNGYLLTQDTFPAGLEAVCNQQMQLAKQGIERCGTPLAKKGWVKVSLRKGEQKINGMWCWQLSQGYWIGGIMEGSSRITVGANPNTWGEVSTGVLFHEFGHYWLITNKGIYGHDPKYDPVFHWSGLGMLTVQTNEPKIYLLEQPYRFIRVDHEFKDAK